MTLSSSERSLTGLIATISAIFSAVGALFIVTTFLLLRMRRTRIMVMKTLRDRAARQKREAAARSRPPPTPPIRSTIVMSVPPSPGGGGGTGDGADYALMVDQRSVSPTPSPLPQPVIASSSPPTMAPNMGSPMMSSSDSYDAERDDRATQRQRRHPASDASLVDKYNTMLLYLALTELLNAATYITSHFIHLQHTNDHDNTPPDPESAVTACQYVGVAMHFSELSVCFWCVCMGIELYLILVRPLRFTLAITSQISSAAPLTARSLRTDSYLWTASSANTVPLLLSSIHDHTSNCWAYAITVFYRYRHVIYFGLTWGLASIIVIVTLLSHSMDVTIYGNTDSSWCWLRSEHEELRLLSYYLFLFISIAVTAIIYVRILKFLTSFREEQLADEVSSSHSASASASPSPSPSIRAQLIRQQRSARFRIILYPLIFLLLNVAAIIDRTYQMVTNDSVFILLLMHSLCSPSQGFVNALVYGATNKRIKQVWGRLCMCGSSPASIPLPPSSSHDGVTSRMIHVDPYQGGHITVGSIAVDYSAHDQSQVESEAWARQTTVHTHTHTHTHAHPEHSLPHITHTHVHTDTSYESSESASPPSPSQLLHHDYDNDGLIADSYDVADTGHGSIADDEDAWKEGGMNGFR